MSSKPTLAPILLLIDLQAGMITGDPTWGPRSTLSLTKNVSSLLSTWRSKSWPILHIHHDDIADDTNPINSKYPLTYAPDICAKPLPGEKTFVKNVGSAFVATGLEAEIDSMRKEGVGRKERKIVAIGMDGAQCVNSTVRHGSDLGYEIIVVEDACASYGMSEEKGWGAEKTHEAAMMMLRGYVEVTDIEGLVGVLGYEK